MYVELTIAVIAILSAIIGSYAVFSYMVKKAKSELPDMLLDILDDLTPELPKILAKEEVRQFIYSVGVLIGNGAKSGVGLQTKSGKFKFEDLLGLAVQQFAPKILGNLTGQQEQTSEQPQQQGGSW